MCTIEIEGMEFYAYHGHFAKEQIVGNQFLVDLKMRTNCSKAGQSDQLEDATDYQIAYRTVKEQMQQKSHLLEHLANRILDALLANLPEISSAEIKIRKLNPPMGGKMSSVSINMQRDR